MADEKTDLIKLLPIIGACKSRSEARRLITGNAVDINGQSVDRFVILRRGDWLRCGKKFFWRVANYMWEDEYYYYIKVI